MVYHAYRLLEKLKLVFNLTYEHARNLACFVALYKVRKQYSSSRNVLTKIVYFDLKIFVCVLSVLCADYIYLYTLL